MYKFVRPLNLPPIALGDLPESLSNFTQTQVRYISNQLVLVPQLCMEWTDNFYMGLSLQMPNSYRLGFFKMTHCKTGYFYSFRTGGVSEYVIVAGNIYKFFHRL